MEIDRQVQEILNNRDIADSVYSVNEMGSYVKIDGQPVMVKGDLEPAHLHWKSYKFWLPKRVPANATELKKFIAEGNPSNKEIGKLYDMLYNQLESKEAIFKTGLAAQISLWNALHDDAFKFHTQNGHWRKQDEFPEETWLPGSTDYTEV